MDPEGAFVPQQMKEYFENINKYEFSHWGTLQLWKDKSTQSANCFTKGIEQTGGDRVDVILEIQQTYNYRMVYNINKQIHAN